MSGSHPARQEGACPRCHGDLEWDSGEVAMACQNGCGYRRDRLVADARDIVVIEGRPVNGTDPNFITLADLARQFDISVGAVQQRLRSRGLTWEFRNGYAGVTPETVAKIEEVRRGGVRSRRDDADKPRAIKPVEAVPPPPGVYQAETRSIRLASGGTVTLTAAVPWFALNREDLEFIFALKDLIDQHERKRRV